MGLLKTEKEIRLLKKAAQIANSCIPLIERSLKEEGVTENELARRIRRKINSQGANLAFQTLVACGERGFKFHPYPHTTDKIISGIGFVDFGARYKGYCSDVTVPFIKGSVSKSEKEIIKTNLLAYKLAVKSVNVGMPCWKLHDTIDSFLRKHGFKMVHALGHGLGRKIHDSPRQIGLSRKVIKMKMRNKLRGRRKRRVERIMSWTFQPKMVFTIEPGIYTKKFGTRIENDFIMLKNKRIKSLTNSRLIVVE